MCREVELAVGCNVHCCTFSHCVCMCVLLLHAGPEHLLQEADCAQVRQLLPLGAGEL